MAQLLDDSTKLVYSAETTFFTTFSGVKMDSSKLAQVDTTLRNTHLWEPVEKSRYYLQDLGTIGTALRPVFYELPEFLGSQSGFGVYDYFYNQPKDLRFFDTKSPFTELTAVFGGNNRAIVEATFSRNVNERWNVGFNFKRYTIDKQIGRTRTRGDLNAITTTYDLFTDYRTEDGKYRVMASFSRLANEVNETGGIIPDTTGGEDFYFDYEDAQINFSDAQSVQIRQYYFLYHQYQLNDLLTFYHQSDRVNEINKFVVPNPVKDTAFLGTPLIRTDSTTERANYGYWQNEIGVKGDLNFIKYGLYYKRRDGIYMPRFLSRTGRQNNQFFGAYAGLVLPIWNAKLDVKAEQGLDGNYHYQAALSSDYLSASIHQMRYDAPFLHQFYFGNYGEWSNTFEPIAATKISAKAKLPLGAIAGISPKVSLSRVNRHTYFNQLKQPEQATGEAVMFSPGVEWKTAFFGKTFHVNGDVIYTNISGTSAEVFRIPEWFGTLNIYWEKNLFDSSLLLRAGTDLHAKSAFYVHAYDPSIMQFYLQDDLLAPAHVFADLYVSFKVASVKVFFKMRHINEGFPTDGYFPTAYYSGTRRVFDLGVNWMFFN